MKEYKKTYENFFQTERYRKRFKLERVSVDGIDMDRYINLFSSEFKKYQKDVFQHLVKISWLMRKYRYNGRRRQKTFWDNEMFGHFMRDIVGFDAQVLKKAYPFGSAIISYFDDLFPDFEVNNPFETEYKYPYRYMTLDCLSLVKNLPERLELLEIGEKKRMKYVVFVDYVVNYILSYNEEKGETIYTLKRPFLRVVKLNK